METNRVPFLFTYVDNLTQRQTLAIIDERIQKREKTQHVVINAGKVVQMHTNRELRDIVNACPIINADGQSVVWASGFMGHALPERVTGIDLMHALVGLAAEKGYRIYLFGARENIVMRTKELFEKQYPELVIAGARNGYYTAADEESIVADMRASDADILFIAFSSPQKEIWVRDFIDKINIPFVMGVGGSFDVVAGATKRAPRWMQRMGLEWFYRLIQEPKRMVGRYFKGNFQFVRLVLRYKFRREERT